MITSPFKTPHGHAVGLFLITTLLWSLSGILLKPVHWHPLAAASLRSGVAALSLLFWLKPSLPVFKELLGAFSYAGMVLFYVTATLQTNVATALFLQNTAPAYVLLLAPLLLKERSRLTDGLAILCAIAGVAMIFSAHLSLTALRGTIAGMLCGIFSALFVLSMRLRKNQNPLIIVFWGNLFAFLIGLPFLVRSPLAPLPWGLLSLAGLFQLAIPFVLYSRAIQNVTALEAILLSTLEVIMNPFWVWWIWKERLPSGTLAGGTLILSGLILRALLQRSPPSPPKGMV